MIFSTFFLAAEDDDASFTTFDVAMALALVALVAASADVGPASTLHAASLLLAKSSFPIVTVFSLLSWAISFFTATLLFFFSDDAFNRSRLYISVTTSNDIPRLLASARIFPKLIELSPDRTICCTWESIA